MSNYESTKLIHGVKYTIVNNLAIPKHQKMNVKCVENKEIYNVQIVKLHIIGLSDYFY
jgi:hypothetical protein